MTGVKFTFRCDLVNLYIISEHVDEIFNLEHLSNILIYFIMHSLPYHSE